VRRWRALLNDIGTLSNPRFGPNRMLARTLELLRAFYDADLCVAILASHDSRGHELRRSTRAAPNSAQDVEEVSAPLAAALLSLGDERVCFRPGFRGTAVVSSTGGFTADVGSDVSRYRAIAELLGVRAYLTVPLRVGTVTQGRLYVGGDEAAFDRGDEAYLLQAADMIMPVLAHIDLAERMATRAAEDERQRLALDIHDRLIQPYIGLQMGIGAVHQIVSRYPDQVQVPALRERIAKLAELSDLGVQHLRSYTRELRGAPATGGLLDSLRRFARRFHEATGIQVTLDVDGELRVDDRLAGEIFSMACEAVSNVRRHTEAPSATIRLRAAGERVVLRVENPAGPDAPRKPFVPRSITERATAINGTVRVEVTDEHSTAVVVEIPL
jgi:signal transduction histidine kinase